MKIEPKHLFAGAAVIAVLIILAAYKFGYAPFIEKADQLKAQNATLETRASELTAKTANRVMYAEGIETSDKIIDSILKKYGPGNTPEKTIMMVVDMCQTIGVTVNNVSFSNEQVVYQSGEKTEEKDTLRVLSTCTTNLTVQGGYTQTKKFFDYVNNYDERMTVNNFSITYNRETGQLMSSVALNLYSVQDKNHHYVAPVIEDIDLGLLNIFRYEEPEIPGEGEEGEEGAVGVTE